MRRSHQKTSPGRCRLSCAYRSRPPNSAMCPKIVISLGIMVSLLPLPLLDGCSTRNAVADTEAGLYAISSGASEGIYKSVVQS